MRVNNALLLMLVVFMMACLSEFMSAYKGVCVCACVCVCVCACVCMRFMYFCVHTFVMLESMLIVFFRHSLVFERWGLSLNSELS